MSISARILNFFVFPKIILIASCKIVCFPSLFLFISYSYSELFIFIRIQKGGKKEEEEDPRAAAGLHDEYKRGRTMPFDASNAKPFMCSGVFGAPLCWVLDGARDVCTSKGEKRGKEQSPFFWLYRYRTRLHECRSSQRKKRSPFLVQYCTI